MRMSRTSKAIIIAVVIAAMLSPALFAQANKPYTMVSIPKLRATWFDRLEVGLKKAGADFGLKVSQQAPAAADEAQQVRLIEDAINQGNNAILVVPNKVRNLLSQHSPVQEPKKL